ncbi:MAG: hypothetical protein ACE366_10875 [Bradymonadia bacterium]
MFSRSLGIVCLALSPASSFAQSEDPPDLVLEASADSTLMPEAEINLGLDPVLDATLGPNGNGRRPIVQFPAWSPPEGLGVAEATLSLFYSQAAYGEGERTLCVHRVLEPWDEGLGRHRWDAVGGAQGVSWIRNTTDTEWNTPGGDIDPQPASCRLISSDDAGQRIDFDVTDAREAPYGYVLIASDMAYRSDRFATREHADPNARPQLTLRWGPFVEEPPPDPGDGDDDDPTDPPELGPGDLLVVAAAADTTLRNGNEINMGAAALLYTEARNGDAPQRPLVTFEAWSVPETLAVSSAQISLFHLASAYGDAERTLCLHRVLEPWVEGEGQHHWDRILGDTGTSWLRTDTDTLWSTPGGAFDEQATACAVLDAEGGRRVTFDVSSDVYWAEYGYIVLAQGSPYRQDQLVARDHPDATLHPQLELTLADAGEVTTPEPPEGPPDPPAEEDDPDLIVVDVSADTTLHAGNEINNGLDGELRLDYQNGLSNRRPILSAGLWPDSERNLEQVTLEVFHTQVSYADDPRTVCVYTVQSSWVEGLGTHIWDSIQGHTGATWLRRDEGLLWATPGGELAAEPLDCAVVDVPGEWISFDVTTDPNRGEFGYALVALDVPYRHDRFTSKDGTATQRPQLAFQYTPEDDARDPGPLAPRTAFQGPLALGDDPAQSLMWHDALAVSPDGIHVAVAAKDVQGGSVGALSLWHRETGALVWRSDTPVWSEGCDFTPEGAFILCAHVDYPDLSAFSLLIFSAADGSLTSSVDVTPVVGTFGSVNRWDGFAASASGDGQWAASVVTGPEGGELMIFSLDGQGQGVLRPEDRIVLPGNRLLDEVAFSPDSQSLYASDFVGSSVLRFDLVEGMWQLAGERAMPSAMAGLDVDGDGRVVVSGYFDRSVHVLTPDADDFTQSALLSIAVTGKSYDVCADSRPGAHWAWAVSQDAGETQAIDTATGEVLANGQITPHHTDGLSYACDPITGQPFAVSRGNLWTWLP